MGDHPEKRNGTAGASARREAERLRAARAERAGARTRAGQLVDAFSEREVVARRRERKWEEGAGGEEEEVARVIAERCPDVLALHDRRLPGSGANIDHISIAPSGVYVVDTKRYRGKVEVINPLLGKPRLIIAGRNNTRLVDGLAKQVRAVRAVLGEDVPVYGCFCFVDPPGLLAGAGIPALWTLRIADFRLYAPRRLARQLTKAGPLTRADAAQIALALGAAFVPN